MMAFLTFPIATNCQYKVYFCNTHSVQCEGEVPEEDLKAGEDRTPVVVIELDEREEADEVGQAGVQGLVDALVDALDVLEEELDGDGGGQVGEVVEAAGDGGVEGLPLAVVQVDLEEEREDTVGAELLQGHPQELTSHGPEDRGQRTEDRGQRSEDRGQRSE